MGAQAATCGSRGGVCVVNLARMTIDVRRHGSSVQCEEATCADGYAQVGGSEFFKTAEAERLHAGEILRDVRLHATIYISGLEQGRRNPTVVTLFELATTLGVSHVNLVLPDQEFSKSFLKHRRGKKD